MNYSRTFGSNFPDELIPVGAKKDIDDSVMSLISQYYSYMTAGNFNAANTLYENNKEILEPYEITMQYINYLAEEIYNTGVMIINKLWTVTTDSEESEPIEQLEGSHWLVEY